MTPQHPARHSTVVDLATRTASLVVRWGPILAAVWLIGDLAQSLLNSLAVMVAFQSRLGGLVVLSLSILVRVAVFVTMFRLLAGSNATGPADGAAPPPPSLTGSIAMVLVPFFLYYAAWGLLQAGMRDYAMLSMRFDPLAKYGPVLEVNAGMIALIWAAGAWLLRFFASRMRKRQPDAAIWPFIVVATEAMWMFIGIFLIARWQDDIFAWLATLGIFVGDGGAAVESMAQATTAEILPPELRAFLWGLFVFAALPLVWFNLAAIVRGRDITVAEEGASSRVTRQITEHWQSVPRAVRDFVGHFINGTVQRWNAVANAVHLTMSASIGLTLAVIVGFRFIDWSAGWGIWATMQLIGPLEYETARIVERALDLLFGTPRSPGTGLLPEVLKVCLLSAALDLVTPTRRAQPIPAT